MTPVQRRACPRAIGVARLFDLPEPITASDYPSKGNMSHDTYLVAAGAGSDARTHVLQRINHHVFSHPHRVVAAAQAAIAAQHAYMQSHRLVLGEDWEPVTFVTTRSGGPLLETPHHGQPSFWRMMVEITGCCTYKSLGELPDHDQRVRVAEEAGRGLAMFGDLVSGVAVCALEDPLPGYRNTALYLDQLDAAVAGVRTPHAAERYLPHDPVLRASTATHFRVHLEPAEYNARLAHPEVRNAIDMVQRNREIALMLQRAMESGAIRRVAIHGDTKLDNFLFCRRSGRVRSLVDLETIMAHTWLADWGDMVRSLVNVAGEVEADLNMVRVDRAVFAALCKGFLSTAHEVTPAETSLMVDAVRSIALELGTRFLADHIRGDTYFRLPKAAPRDLNRTRALVQLRLFEELTLCRDDLEKCVSRHSAAPY